MEFPLAGTGIHFTGVLTLKSFCEFFPATSGRKGEGGSGRGRSPAALQTHGEEQTCCALPTVQFPKEWEKTVLTQQGQEQPPIRRAHWNFKGGRIASHTGKTGANEFKHPGINWNFAAADFLLSKVSLRSATSLQSIFPSHRKGLVSSTSPRCAGFPQPLLFSATSCTKGCRSASFLPALSWERPRVGTVSAAVPNFHIT